MSNCPTQKNKIFNKGFKILTILHLLKIKNYEIETNLEVTSLKQKDKDEKLLVP